MKLEPRRVAVVIAANLVPLASILVFGGDVFFLLLLFWAESAIAGIFNVLMMATAKGHGGGKLSRFAMIPFFMIHYGMFMFVHLIFLMFFLTFATFDIGVLAYFSANWRLFALNILALFLSYLYEFIYFWVIEEEREKTTLGELMTRPYPRIVVMQLTIIFGAFLYFTMGDSVVFLLLLVDLKTAAAVLMNARDGERVRIPEIS
jgi:hypothetical protein